MKNKVLRKVLLCILAAVLCLPLLERVTRVSAADPAAQIKIGVLAKRGDRICLEKWSPMARYLSAVLPEYSFSIVPLDFKEIVPAVEQQEIDFVLANSAIYTGLEILYGVSRIATMKNLLHGQGVTEFGGTVFYKAGRNDINTLKDLSGKSFMGVDRTSFGGWLMALREFKLQNINPDKDFSELLFGDTHDNVVYAVLSGKVDAGTVRTDTLERMAAENKISLNDFKVIPFTRHVDPELTEAIIHESQYRKFPYLLSTHLYPEWPLAKLRGTADEVSRQIAIALYTLPADSEAAQAAQISGWTIPLPYQPVRQCLMELRVWPYDDLGHISFADVLRKYWPWMVLVFVVTLTLAFLTLFIANLNRKLAHSKSVLEGYKNELEERVAARTEELQKALDEIKTLSGILPLCSFCKKIRDDEGHWEQVDTYIHKHSEADISHGLCPECAKKHYPEFFSEEDGKKSK